MATSERDEARAAHGVTNGTVVPNRVFVGGISSKTNEDDLRNLFSKYGCVKATKIIFDKNGSSKGYGFVTFETEEEARRVIDKKDRLTLKERTLNIAAAVKKHPFHRNLDSAGSMQTAPVVWSAHHYAGSTNYPNREPLYYPQAPWPLMWHQQLYLPQQCAYPQNPQPGCPQLIYSVAPPDYGYQNVSQTSDFSETSSADSGESGIMRSRTSPAPTAEYEKSRSAQTKTCHAQGVCIPKYNGYVENANSYGHASPVPPMHVLAKTVNGVAVMAYPTPFLMGSPAIVHMKDDTETMLSDMGYMHSPIATGALTPPPTPMAPISCDFGVNTSMESSRKN